MATRKSPAKPAPRPRRDIAREETFRTRAQVKLWLAPDGLAVVDELAAALVVDRGAAVVAACRAALATLAGDASGARVALDGAPALVATPGRKPKTAAAKKK